MEATNPQQLALSALFDAPAADESVRQHDCASQDTAVEPATTEPPASRSNAGEGSERVAPPMLRQYQELKQKFPEHKLLIQVGDFYEIFYEDARVVSEALSIRLTSRDKAGPDAVPMCGVPIHAIDSYIPRLLDAGLSCVLVSQVEDERKKGVAVRREITRIITPGVRYEGDGLQEKSFNFLCSAVYAAGGGAVSYTDVSTGLLRVSETESIDDLTEAVERLRPAEILLPSTLFSRPVDRATGFVREIREVASRIGAQVVMRPFENRRDEALRASVAERLLRRGEESVLTELSREAKAAVGTLLDYVDEVSFGRPPRFSSFSAVDRTRSVFIDSATRRNLELFETRLEGTKRHSLFSHIDCTKTAMGSRFLTAQLLEPSSDLAEINARLDAVETLTSSPLELDAIRDGMACVRDLERILSRVTSQRANPRDLQALGSSLGSLPQLREVLVRLDAARLSALGGLLPDLTGLATELDSAFVDEPPSRFNEGGIFRRSYHPELDELHELSSGARTVLAELEVRERERSGIPSLKVRYTGVFGYFLEVTKSHLSKVPPHFERRQTLVNAERFVTPELKQLEVRLLSARGREIELEKELFLALREKVANAAADIQRVCLVISELDMLCAFAKLARDGGYVRPSFVDTGELTVKGGRHPVVERVIGRHNFHSNDISLDTSGRRLSILTGPNMGGKSTYLRQIGLIQILAQIGSFVPADSATISLVDRIFTRIGAADDLSRGDSTFMVEMREATTIIKKATERSLVLIDEIGRGTATADGLAIATAIAEWLHERIRCKTVFATHFHELTSLSTDRDGMLCLSVGVLERDGDVEFTHRIEERPADRSYGIEVARLAGLPERLIARAKEVLATTSTIGNAAPGIGGAILPPALAPAVDTAAESQLLVLEELVSELSKLDPNELTPIDALIQLSRLKKRASDLKPRRTS
ncbi:MAG: DNA mismatch repair protein MutS [Deltaproteobacteria bacterium]|nr:DNA mismatch repair protein MutS [Deltaproteobacteria bacterium]